MRDGGQRLDVDTLTTGRHGLTVGLLDVGKQLGPGSDSLGIRGYSRISVRLWRESKNAVSDRPERVSTSGSTLASRSKYSFPTVIPAMFLVPYFFCRQE